MVLSPECEGRVGCSLYTKNVRFTVKRRGCCCNLFGGVAVNARFHHERNVCEEQHPYVWDAIIERSWRMISIFACCNSVKLCELAAQAFRSQQGYHLLCIFSLVMHIYAVTCSSSVIFFFGHTKSYFPGNKIILSSFLGNCNGPGSFHIQFNTLMTSLPIYCTWKSA